MENEKEFLKETAALFMESAVGKKMTIEITKKGTSISENCDSDAAAFTLLGILEKCYVRTEEDRRTYESAKMIAAKILEEETKGE